MGKASQKRKEAARWREQIRLLRQKWLDQEVCFDVGQGRGMRHGRVITIGDDGGFVIEVFAVPGDRASMVTMSLGYADRLLSLVDVRGKHEAYRCA